LGAVATEKLDFLKAGTLKFFPGKIFLGISQGGGFYKPPGIDHIEGVGVGPERICVYPLEIRVIRIGRGDLIPGDFREYLPDRAFDCWHSVS
jgi:hypothetical protein